MASGLSAPEAHGSPMFVQGEAIPKAFPRDSQLLPYPPGLEEPPMYLHGKCSATSEGNLGFGTCTSGCADLKGEGSGLEMASLSSQPFLDLSGARAELHDSILKTVKEILDIDTGAIGNGDGLQDVIQNPFALQTHRCVCGTPLLPNARFCTKCGRKSEETCHECGAAYLPRARFCCMCGAAKQDVSHKCTMSCTTDDSTTWGSPHTCAPSDDSSPLHSQRSVEFDTEAREITTMMICDIPCRRTVEQLMEAIDAHGFSNTYNLVYMPHQKGRRSHFQSQNVGYGFVNFKKPEWATAFMNVFRNVRFPASTSEKLSYAKPARCQGYEENLEMHGRKTAAGALVTLK